MKQVNFAIHIATLNGGGINGAMTSEGFTAWVKTQHPFEDGWRVDSASVVSNTADGIGVMILATQWKDENAKVK